MSNDKKIIKSIQNRGGSLIVDFAEAFPRGVRSRERPRTILKTLQITAAEIHRAVKSTTLDRRLQQLWRRDRNAKECAAARVENTEEESERGRGLCSKHEKNPPGGNARILLFLPLSLSLALIYRESKYTVGENIGPRFAIQYTRTCTRDVTRV